MKRVCDKPKLVGGLPEDRLSRRPEIFAVCGSYRLDTLTDSLALDRRAVGKGGPL